MAQRTRFTEYVTPERTFRLFTGGVVRYQISLDPELCEIMARKALQNKSRRAMDGPLKITITEEPQ